MIDLMCSRTSAKVDQPPPFFFMVSVTLPKKSPKSLDSLVKSIIIFNHRVNASIPLLAPSLIFSIRSLTGARKSFIALAASLNQVTLSSQVLIRFTKLPKCFVIFNITSTIPLNAGPKVLSNIALSISFKPFANFQITDNGPTIA